MQSFTKELTTFKNDTRISLQRAATYEAFQNTLQQIIESMGFSNFDITLIEENLNLTIAMSTMPSSLLESYFSEQYDKHDLTIKYSTMPEYSPYYSDLRQYLSKSPAKITDIAKTLAVYDLMSSFNLHDAYSRSEWHNNHQLMFSVMTEGLRPEEFKRLLTDRRSRISFLSTLTCELLTLPKFLPHTSNSKNIAGLTKKQIEIIAAMGKHSMTQQQAADHVGLAEATVRLYCHEIKQKLGVKTMPGAVFEAIRLGIITAS